MSFECSFDLVHPPYTQVIKLDPSSHRGYEMRYAALHGAGDYDEAIDAVLCMLSNIESSPNEGIRRTYLRHYPEDHASTMIYRATRKLYPST